VPPPTVPPPTAAPTEVRVPAFGVVGQEYGNALFYIRQRIAEACAPGPACLTPTTQVTAAAPAAPGPCVITQEPAPGLPVARGSTLTFFVDRPCTTTASPTASASSEPTTEPPPSAPPPSVVVDPAPSQVTRIPLEPPVRVPAPEVGPTTTAKSQLPPKPKPKPSAVVVEPSQPEVQQAPDAGTPSP
jgi:hypothetical protein